MIKDIEKSKEYIWDSAWLSDYEKENLTRETPPLPPPYLVDAAFEAVKEEADFYAVLKEKLPEVYDYLSRMKEWLDREDKTPGNFPGFPDRFEKNILDTIFPPLEEKSQEEKEETIAPIETTLPSTGSYSPATVDALKKLSSLLTDFITKIEVNKIIKSTRLLGHIIEKVDIKFIFDGILKIENDFQRYRFIEATKTIKEMLGISPGLVFLYEYYFQALKISEELDLNAVKAILKEFFKEIPPHLYDVMYLFFEFEQIYLDGKQRFLEKIDDYKLNDDYAYVKPYLLSKYFLYYGEGDNALQKASDYISKAIGIAGTSTAETLLFLYHHQIKVLLAQKNFAGIRSLVTTLFKESTPLYYKYILLLETCFKSSDSNYQEECKCAMESFILSYARENNLQEVEELFSKSLETVKPESEEIEKEKSPEKDESDIVKEEIIKEKANDKLWQTVQELKQVITGLGFAEEDEYKLEREVDRLTGLREYDEAQQLIEANLNSPHSEMQRYNLLDRLFVLYRKQERLDTLIQRYRDNYVNKPDFNNTYSYFLLLNNMEGKYRYEAKEISLLMMRKYYFLPVVYGLFFNVEHYKFTKKTFTKEAEKAMALAVSCGLTPGLFENYAEFYRWQGKHNEGNLFGLMDGFIFNESFRTNIICSYKTGWKEIALAFFLIGFNRFPRNHNIYNCFSIALDKSIPLEQMVSLLLCIKAINVYSGKSGTLLTNKSISIVEFSKRYRYLSKNALYGSLQAVTADPHHTWLSYEALLTSAENLGKDEIYLPAFYTALDYECPQIKEEHLLKAKQIVSGYLEKKDFHGGFPFSVFLARALVDDKPYWIEDRNILDTEGAAFDILIQVEKLLEKGEISNFFLGDHAYEEFLSLTSQDWYLLYRFPNQTFEEKYKIKLDTLRELEQLYPLSRHRKDLKAVSQENTVKRFIASLNSGRVHSSIPATIDNSKGEALRILAEYYQRSGIFLEKLHALREDLHTYAKEIIQAIVEAMGMIYKEMEPTRQVKLKSDLFLLFRSTRKQIHDNYRKFIISVLRHNLGCMVCLGDWKWKIE